MCLCNKSVEHTQNLVHERNNITSGAGTPSKSVD